MIPILYNEDMTERLGLIVETKNARVTEVANGIFDYEFEYPIDSPLTNIFENQQIIVVDASEELKAQKFRIFEIEKRLKTSILVRAQHRFFDLRKDSIEVLSLEHETCEYAVNQIFRNSDHSQEFKGYSDIVNAQGYYNKDVSCLEAIVGKEGSIIDTYGNGAQLLRDNENVHVLKRRGQHRNVTIEYGKNMTGFKLTEDFTNVFTRIKPYAIKRAEGDNPETIIRGGVVDSPRIGNYRMVMTKNVDYTSKFEQGEEITAEKLRIFAQQEYDINHIDVPKVSADVSFIPLQKCVGYKGQFDNIGLFDTVIVKHKKYNYETEIRVVEYVYDPIKERPHSMKLGDARESLASIIGGNNNTVTKDEVKDMIEGAPSKPPVYPDRLPQVSQLSGKVIGLNSIELNWNIERDPAYTYELYGNKDPNFEPKEFDLIFEGKGSSFLYTSLPDESWTFVVCGKNTHGSRTMFSNRVTLETAKIDAGTFIKEATIGNALLGDVSADKITSGTISTHLLDLRNFRQTDGDGNIIIDIDSYGRAYMNLDELRIKSKHIATEEYVDIIDKALESYIDTQFNILDNKISQKVSQTVYDSNNQAISNKFSQMQQTVDGFEYSFGNVGAENIIKNAWGKAGLLNWNKNIYNGGDSTPVICDIDVAEGNSTEGWVPLGQKVFRIRNYGTNSAANNHWCGIEQYIHVEPGATYTVSYYCAGHRIVRNKLEIKRGDNNAAIAYKDVYADSLSGSVESNPVLEKNFTFVSHTFTVPSDCKQVKLLIFAVGKTAGNAGFLWIAKPQMEIGSKASARRESSSEVLSDTITVQGSGIEASHSDGISRTRLSSQGLEHIEPGMTKPYHYITDVKIVDCKGKTNGTWFKVYLGDYFKGKRCDLAWQMGNVSCSYGRVLAGYSVDCRNYNSSTGEVEMNVKVFYKSSWDGGAGIDADADAWAKVFIWY